MNLMLNRNVAPRLCSTNFVTMASLEIKMSLWPPFMKMIFDGVYFNVSQRLNS